MSLGRSGGGRVRGRQEEEHFAPGFYMAGIARARKIADEDKIGAGATRARNDNALHMGQSWTLLVYPVLEYRADSDRVTNAV